MDNKKLFRRLTFVGIGGNLLLVLLRAAAGVWGHSAALLTDAVHSAADVLVTLIAALGAYLARHFGRPRVEPLASLLLSLLLTGTGAELARRTLSGEGGSEPTAAALLIALMAVPVKELMSRLTRLWAKQLGSDAFLADAAHHHTDALASLAVFFAVFAAMCGLPGIDSAAGVVISLCILKTALDVLRTALPKLFKKASGK